MIVEIKSEKTDSFEMNCDNKLTIKNYWQSRIMLAVSCNEETGSVRVAVIFKLDGTMVLMAHTISYATQSWRREISHGGNTLLYDKIWNYKTADRSGEVASVDLIEDSSSIDDSIYENRLIYNDIVFISN